MTDLLTPSFLLQQLSRVAGEWEVAGGRLLKHGRCPLAEFAHTIHPELESNNPVNLMPYLLQRPMTGNEEVAVSEIMMAADHDDYVLRPVLEQVLGYTPSGQ